MKKTFFSISALVLGLSSNAVFAGTTGPYSLISIGWGKMSTDYVSNIRKAITPMGGIVTESSESKNVTSGKVGLGYQFNDNFGFEAAVCYFGKATGKSTIAGIGPWLYRNTYSTESIGAVFDAIGSFPVTENFSVFGKGGFGIVRTEQKITLVTLTKVERTTERSTRFVPTLGAGVEYSINPEWTFRVEYEHFFGLNKKNNKNITGTDCDIVSFGVKFAF